MSSALVALLALAAAASSGERSPVIFPAQSLPVRFDHAEHLSGGADCLTCHDKARKSTRASDWNLPGHPECEQCHDLKKEGCAKCHPGFDQTARAAPPRIAFPTANLIFDHQVHVSRKIACERCHEDVSKVNLATVQQLPKMATCLGCHDGTTAPSACTTCHLRDASSGRLQLTFAQGSLRPMAGNPFGIDHGPRFEFTHSALGSTARSTCLACHADRDCQKCHDGMQKPLAVHPNDWISLHALQARGQIMRCEACHRLQSFCLACHERSGVSNEGLSLPAQNLKVHGDRTTWTGLVDRDRTTMTGGHHAFQAARDIRTCMSCHREETCLKCHSQVDHPSLLGRPATPHPPGFAAACRRLASLNDRGCVLCHDEGYLAAQGCR